MRFKSLLLFIILFILLTALSQSTYAGEKFEFAFYGYSEDLKYCAFETYGIVDGEGLAHSNIYFINIDTDSYAHAPFELKGEESLIDIRTKNMQNAESTFQQLHISKYKSGEIIFENPPSKYSIDFTIKGKKYDIYLDEINFPDNSSFPELDIKGFNLSVKKPDGSIQIMNKDNTLPESRKTATSYKLLEGYIFDTKLIVFIEYNKLGFEGSSIRQLLVSANIGKSDTGTNDTTTPENNNGADTSSENVENTITPEKSMNSDNSDNSDNSIDSNSNNASSNNEDSIKEINLIFIIIGIILFIIFAILLTIAIIKKYKNKY